MKYSFTEKKRIRKDFGKRQSILDVPFLLETQIRSYEEFLQLDIPAEKRRERGLHGRAEVRFPDRGLFRQRSALGICQLRARQSCFRRT